MKAKTLASVAVMWTLLSILPVVAQSQNVNTELKRLTQQWYDAFDKGDGAKMDQMEVANLVLVNADSTGSIWHKKGLRAGKQKASAQVITVGASEVRQFGDTAILTGAVTTKEGDKTEELSETIVWIRENNKWLLSSGQWSDVTPKKSN